MEVKTRGQRAFKFVGMGFLLFVLFSLYAPLLVMTSLSFTEAQTSTFPPENLSFISYDKLFHPDRIELFTIAGEPITDYWGPLQLSVLLGIVTAVVATVLGLCAAIAFRQQFRGRNTLFFVLLLGMISPGIVVGLGIRLLATALELEPRWYTTGLLVHVGWTLPFSFVIFMIFLNRFDRQIEEAASMLGATALQVFRHVTLPILRPAVLASLLFGFTLSFDELQRSALALGQDMSLPRALVSVTTIRVTPVVYALGAIIAIASLGLVLVYLIMFERDAKKLYVATAAKDDE